jgi:transketolase
LNALNAYGPLLPELVGGSADLAESNLTHWSGSHAITGHSVDGNYLNYGVREFGMVAIMNGIALHGGFIPYGGTFLVFSDYARNAIRMAALMGARSIYVLTHDSIGLGEDGPTHQPVEHAASLRLIPNLSLWRPCDPVETAVAWKLAIERKEGPTALLLTRQALEPQQHSAAQVENIARGGYVLVDAEGDPEAILLATGSEVQLAVAAAAELRQRGRLVRVVSMPSTDLFDAQDAPYRDSVLPLTVRKRVAIEAGAGDYWYKYVGLDGKVIGVNSFGESAPGDQVFQHFGFTVENIVKTVDAMFI